MEQVTFNLLKPVLFVKLFIAYMVNFRNIAALFTCLCGIFLLPV